MATTYPPDGYEMGSGTWGTDADYETGSGSVSGDGYIEFKDTTPASDAYIRSDAYIPVEAGSPYSLFAWLYASAIGATDTFQLAIAWYTNAKVFISATDVFAASALSAATTWEIVGGIANAPATAKYARPLLYKNNNGGWTGRVDSWSLRRYPVSFRAYRGSSQSINSASATKIQFDTNNYNYGSAYDNSTYKFTAPSSGLYALHASGELQALGDGKLCYLELWINGSPLTRGGYVPNGAASNMIATVTEPAYPLTVGDYVEIYITHDHGSARTLTGSTVKTYFTGAQVE